MFFFPAVSGMQINNIIMKINTYNLSGINKVSARLLWYSAAAVAVVVIQIGYTFIGVW